MSILLLIVLVLFVPQTPPAAASNKCDLLCCLSMVALSFFSFFLVWWATSLCDVTHLFFWVVLSVIYCVAHLRRGTTATLLYVLYHSCRRSTKKEALTSSPSSSGTFFMWDFLSSITVVALVHRLRFVFFALIALLFPPVYRNYRRPSFISPSYYSVLL